eukprot:TRINITY_DN102472_c0_g1_i1.p1 TRINITY_DN102472_c0_g1~~TRINITY_DN102472_c0_g1_i1.p1  ORF type:complete len:540 (-),score=108.54 TRINITY_DN102472_c0_g1_i1:67-1686(-)
MAAEAAEAAPQAEAAAPAVADAAAPLPSGEGAGTAGTAPASVASGSTALVVPAIVPAIIPAAASLEPQPKKVLVVGDETLMFSAGLQIAYPEVEFTASTVLARQNLEAQNLVALPPALKGRVRHMQDPTKIFKNYPPGSFDDLVLFLPGLAYVVPKEMGTSDRPLFAYRTHHYVFHVVRSVKAVLRGQGQLHLVWPEETSLMSSPCGAAGIEMVQLLTSFGCRPAEEVTFSMDKVSSGHFWPIVFGEVPKELPEWLHGAQMHTFSLDSSPIEVPLSAALQLPPDLHLVNIKDASPSQPGKAPPPPFTAPLKAKLIHEAMARKDRLKEIYGPKEEGSSPTCFDLVKDGDQDCLLSVPMEVFTISFEEVSHIGHCMVFRICNEQPPVSVVAIEMLDPRLPTRIARPAPPSMIVPAIINAVPVPMRKRSRPKDEEWAEMKFYCPLTKICTATTEKMREHMNSEVYKRFAARNPGWETSDEKKDLLIDIETEEAEEMARRMKKGKGKNDGKGKGDGKKGKGGKGKDDKGKSGGKGDKGKGKSK